MLLVAEWRKDCSKTGHYEQKTTIAHFQVVSVFSSVRNL